MTRITFMPPPVEPAEAPITISPSRASRANSFQLSKSAVVKPVVVITLTAVKVASRIPRPTSSTSAASSRLITSGDDRDDQDRDEADRLGQLRARDASGGRAASRWRS